MVQVELSRVIISELNEQQAIYLREVDGDRSFPILIGEFEASIINRRVLEDEPYRPMTHQLLANVIHAMGGKAESVEITEMKDHTYYAEVTLRQGDEVLKIDSRPSDAIALAVHCEPNLPIFVADDVFDEILGDS